MKKKIIAILGIIIVISVCGGIYLHISRANEKIETIEQETESTQEETLPTEETETMETTETESVELETETSFQEETTETQEIDSPSRNRGKCGTGKHPNGTEIYRICPGYHAYNSHNRNYREHCFRIETDCK